MELIKGHFYVVTKDIRLYDGTFIKSGTHFLVEGFDNGKYSIHFSAESVNRYINPTGEYLFSLFQLQQFSYLEVV